MSLAARFVVVVCIAVLCQAGNNMAQFPSGSEKVSRSGDEIVVTARGMARPVSATPGSVGVLTRDEIEDGHPVSITDSFKLVPGVARVGDGAWGGDASIRGLSRDSVVMMVDGCRVNTATDINARFGLIDPMEIERVEILKGPISSLYGSGSMGGVVNVITRSGRFSGTQKWDAGLAGSYGSNPRSVDLFGFANFNTSDTFFYASQTGRKHESYEDGDGKEVRNSQYEDNGTKLRGGFLLQGHEVEINFQYYEGKDIGIPGAGTAPLPAVADITYPTVLRRMISVSDALNINGMHWKTSKLTVYSQDIERNVRIDNFPAASPLLSVLPSAKHKTQGGQWINTVAAGKNGITAGVDGWQRKLVNSKRIKNMKSGQMATEQPLPEATFVSGGAFIEDDLSLTRRFTLNAGARDDQIQVSNEQNPTWPERETEENTPSGHVGATWKITDKLNMKISAAAGYRAASIEERYQYLDLGGGITKYGDPELKPEKSQSFEYGINWLGDKLYLSTSVFMNRYTDLIGEEKVDEQTIRNANINKAMIQGVEGEGRVFLAEKFQLYANFAYLDGKNTQTDEPLAGIAPLSILCGLLLGGKDDGPWARIGLNHSMKQDKVPAGVSEASAWTTVDAMAGWRFHLRGSLQSIHVGVNNMLDAAYRNYLTTYRGNYFNEPGRSMFAGYQVEF
ncbi:MAG: hypothetical protein C0404_08835 [Verrucomicrobia bacterium]|nr:hypothetical protein [Verrucomicrobiota bacterium]